MHLRWSGARTIAAPPARVWQDLVDPDVVATCAGADGKATRLADGRYAVTCRIGVAFFKFPITMEVTMHDLVPPSAGRMTVSGTGPGTGLEGRSAVRLSPGASGGTTLDWEAETTVHGRLTEFGATLMEPLIRRMIDEFWDDFAHHPRP
jgi:carbon monoxide dehydrogenase subunit G